MAAADILILVRPEGWRLVAVENGSVRSDELPVAGDGLDRSGAEAIAAAIRQCGRPGRGIALTVPSTRAFSAAISTEGLPRSNRRQAMVYRLEEQLPWPAEDLAADFTEHGRTALGIAVRADRLRETLFELEAAGVFVQLVCPTAILAFQGLRGQLPPSGPSFAAVGLDGQVELAGFLDGWLASWECLPPEPARLLPAMKAGLLMGAGEQEAVPLLAIGLDETLRLALASVGELKVEAADGASPLELVGLGAAAILRGRARPWCDLRRGQLAPADRLRPVSKALRSCVASFLVLLAALIAAPNWRASRQEALAEACRADQAAVFRRLHPGRRVPTAVHWRLEAEARRLSGLRGDSAEAPARRSGLEDLREMFTRLPEGIAMQVLELRVEPTGFLIEGRVKGHVDAERIASSLRESPALEVDPPRTERLPKVVAFTLTGRFADAREEGTVP